MFLLLLGGVSLVFLGRLRVLRYFWYLRFCVCERGSESESKSESKRGKEEREKENNFLNDSTDLGSHEGLCNPGIASLNGRLRQGWFIHYRQEQLSTQVFSAVLSTLSLSLVKQDISFKILTPERATGPEKGGLLMPHILSLSKSLKLLCECVSGPALESH